MEKKDIKMEKAYIKIGKKYTITSGNGVPKRYEGTLCQVRDVFKTKASVQLIQFGMGVVSIPFTNLEFFSDFIFKSRKVRLNSHHVSSMFSFEYGKIYDTVECPEDEKINYEKDIWILSPSHGPVRLLLKEYAIIE